MQFFFKKKRNLKNLIFSYSGNNAHCDPSGYFYEEGKNPMSFEVKQIYKSITIEIYCECEKLKSMNVWLRESGFSNNKNLLEYIKKIESSA